VRSTGEEQGVPVRSTGEEQGVPVRSTSEEYQRDREEVNETEGR